MLGLTSSSRADEELLGARAQHDDHVFALLVCSGDPADLQDYEGDRTYKVALAPQFATLAHALFDAAANVCANAAIQKKAEVN